MSELIRFGVSLDKELLGKFDKLISGEKYTNRSEAIRDLIREKFVKQEWKGSKEIAGAIILVYDHHKRELLNSLTDAQHDFYHIIVSSQHVHLDHHHCLEMIIVKGKTKEVEGLANKLKSTKGVKFSSLTPATTGKGLS